MVLAPAAVAQTGTLATEPFSGNSGALNGLADGSGWAGGWQVQNNDTAVPGYGVASSAPLSASTGSYGVGGSNWQTAGRTLDTTASGPFAPYLSNGLIGLSGKTVYFSVWLRMDTATGDEISATLHAGGSPAWYAATPLVSVGYFGGSRYWSCKVAGTVYQSAVPVTVGKAAQLMVGIDFGAPSKVRFYVNPPASTLPATPDATATASASLAFRSVMYNGGTASGESSIDEIRLTAPAGTGTTASSAHPRFGMNLAAVADYSRELPFVDVFKMARPWIPQAQGKAWGQGPALAVDANGWITSLQAGQYAETILMDNALDDQAHYPSGPYTLLYDGQGTLAFDLQSATVLSQTQGRMVVNVPAGGSGVYLMETATNPSNPIRNIRFVMPGFEGSYLAQPFNPAFLNAIQEFKALRFMEWSLTNGSAVRQWSDRATPADYTYTWRGVPLEVELQLANTLKLPAWFNIPAMASDAYVKQFAALVNAQLSPSLGFYLEYSNETWNSEFSQQAYVQQQGLALGLSTDPTVAAAAYTAQRSTQIFALVRAGLANPGRMVRVLASQAANPWLSEQTVAYGGAYTQADALAIAPYFNCSDTATGGFGILGDPATASQVAAMPVDQIVDIELQHINGCAETEMTGNAAVARKYGLKLVAYEGGQSLVGYGGAENNAALTAVFKAANRSPRMQSLYTTYLQNWIAAGGDLFVDFNDVTGYTKYGSWGALEYQDQDPATAPKYEALAILAAQYQ
jgi:hypothetical protein